MARLSPNRGYAALTELRQFVLPYVPTSDLIDLVNQCFEMVYDASATISLHLLLHPTPETLPMLHEAVAIQLTNAESAIMES